MFRKQFSTLTLTFAALTALFLSTGCADGPQAAARSQPLHMHPRAMGHESHPQRTNATLRA